MSSTTRTISSPDLNATITTSTSVSNSSGSYATDLNGGYMASKVDDDATALLAKALGDDKFYAEDVPTRLCFTAIDSVHEQVVAGTNYKYTVDACVVEHAGESPGKCSEAVLKACKPEKYNITVFEQTWTEMLQVSEIELTTSSRETEGSTSDNQAEAVEMTKNGGSKAADQLSITGGSNETSKTPAPKSASRRTSLGVATVLVAALGFSVIPT